MGYFSTPIAVKPLPESDAVRISVRASETRVDEWTVLRSDVESVLDGYEDDFYGWRGVGELRVRMGRSGSDIAFYDGDDRALLRLSPSEAASFMAHLRACMFELGVTGLPPARPRPQTAPAAPTVQVAVAPAVPAAPSVELEALRGMMQQVMMAVITLTSDVNRMMQRQAERDADRAAQPAVAPQVIQVVQPPVTLPSPIVSAPQDADMFIPSMGTAELAGAGLEAKEKTGSSSDLAEAAAALKAAKKRRTKKKED